MSSSTIQFHTIVKGLLVLIFLVLSACFFVKLVAHTENLKIIDFAINRPELITESMMVKETDAFLEEKWVSEESLGLCVFDDGWEIIAVDSLLTTLTINKHTFQTITPLLAKRKSMDLLKDGKRLILVSLYQNYYSFLIMRFLKDQGIDTSNVFVFDSENEHFLNGKNDVDLLTSIDMKKLSYEKSTAIFIDSRPRHLKINNQFKETYHIPIDEELMIPVDTLNRNPIILASFGRFSYIDSLGVVKRLKSAGVTSIKGIFVTPENWENPWRAVE
jgi:hypothetical protein